MQVPVLDSNKPKKLEIFSLEMFLIELFFQILNTVWHNVVHSHNYGKLKLNMLMSMIIGNYLQLCTSVLNNFHRSLLLSLYFLRRVTIYLIISYS